MSKFLVTGGAGFIGSNLCEALIAMGHQVRCLDDFSTGHRGNLESFENSPLFELIEGDIRELDTCLKACEGMDYVLHQAAWGSVPRSIEMPLLYEDINVRGTLNMLEAAKVAGVKRFVYASSSAVYGDSPILPKQEEVTGGLLSPYAFTKHANEEYAKLYTKLYGLETVGLRYFNVFGPRQDPKGAYAAVIPKFVSSLLAGEAPVIHGDGKQSRDFTYVANVVEANLKACLGGEACAGEVFNVAYGGQETLLSIYEVISQLVGVNIQPTFTAERKGDIKHSNADISKARALLGYDPQFDFKAGLTLCVDWYKELYGKTAN